MRTMFTAEVATEVATQVATKVATKLAIALLACGCSWPVLAAEVAGVNIEDKASVGGKELVLNGAGLRTRAIFKVYVSSLFLPAKANTLDGVLANTPRRIQLNMLRSVSADQFGDTIQEGLKENNSAADLAAVKPQIDQLLATLKAVGDVKEKDIITLDFVDGATRIAINGTAKGAIPGEPMNRALTKIWLGDNPVQVDLKKAMLGG